ncbi:MAG TPA: TetR/AcrR family transcriptional regulator [Capillimicrobium sp.]|nr:TetR/AcrR family transcriptional regulator [Capillimicrobium sp.]
MSSNGNVATRSRRRQTPEETRAVILDSAERLLRERPFREISVDEVMKPTGYRRTVFYRHFPGLPELVLAVLARTLPDLAEANESFRAIASEELDAGDVRPIVRRVVEHWERHGPLMLALRDAGVYDAEIDALIDQTQERFIGLLAEVLEQRQQAGWGRGADPRQLATALTSMNQRYLLHVFGRREPRATVEDATEALTTIWTAVVSSRGA